MARASIKKKKAQNQLIIQVIKDRVLGIDVLRGYARLCDLARISKADVYDQRSNPTGTQRDLSPKHARDAYNYIAAKELAFWPEIFLCVREKTAISIIRQKASSIHATLKVNLKKATNPENIAISRVDGNHRLHLADGTHEGYPAIEKKVSFCLAYNLSLEQEIQLFRDINNNQRRMNTSHLDNIEIRLSPEDKIKLNDPALYIADRLGKDPKSPFYQRIYEGGAKLTSTVVPLRSMKSGIGYMLSQPTKLTALQDAEAQYRVIKNFFNAVRNWVPEAWESPKNYLVLRGAGLWGICFIGAEVIDRVLGEGNFKSEEMEMILRSGRDWDWSNRGDFQGFSGRGGAVRIRDEVVGEFQDETGVSIRGLFREIMQD